MKVLVVCHRREEDLGTLCALLKARNLSIEYVLGHEDKLPNIDACEHDLTIIMGGSMGVYEAEQHPYLLNEIDYIQRRIKADKPLLGVCLGGQLIAKALGGDVYKGAQGKEAGWCDLQITPAGKNSAIRHLDVSHTKMMQWHQDTFDLPYNANLLATSNQYKHQAFSYGDKILGVQFHPELDADMIERWLNEKEKFLSSTLTSKDDIAKDTKIYITKLRKQTALFFNEWLDEVM